MPPELSYPGIQQVLKSTTQFQSRQDPWVNAMAFMDSDLVRPQSRVCRDPDGGVIAIHRKQLQQFSVQWLKMYLFTGVSISRWATEVLENKLNGADRFALEGSRVYGKMIMIHLPQYNMPLR